VVVLIIGLLGVLLLERRLPRVTLEVDGAEAVCWRRVATLRQEHLSLSIHLQSLEGLESLEWHFLAVGVREEAVILGRILKRVCQLVLEWLSGH
jgi:hypothetical protein